jgi:hypothetical protein
MKCLVSTDKCLLTQWGCPNPCSCSIIVPFLRMYLVPCGIRGKKSHFCDPPTPLAMDVHPSLIAFLNPTALKESVDLLQA